MALTVLIVDDHELVREGLRAIMERTEDIAVVGEASTAADAVKAVRKLKPDVAVVDVGLPGTSGLQLARELSQRYPRTKLLILSMHTEEAYVTEALRLGAKGYVVKGAGTGEVVTGVRAVHNGETFISPGLAISRSFTPGQEAPPTSGFDRLTEREVEVLKLVAAGNTSKEIGEQLNIAGRTAEAHRSHILCKLGLSSHSDLLVYAVKHDLLTKSY
jgi:two-component system response regulator NreC